MCHRVLLTALVVCSLGISLAAIHPASATVSGGSATETPVWNETGGVENASEGANETLVEPAETVAEPDDGVDTSEEDDGDGNHEERNDAAVRNQTDGDIEASHASIERGVDDVAAEGSDFPAADRGTLAGNATIGAFLDAHAPALLGEGQERVGANGGTGKMVSGRELWEAGRAASPQTSGNSNAGDGRQIAADRRADSTGKDRNRDGEESEFDAGSDAGVGAALLVTVGCLGGTRGFLGGTATLASSEPKTALTVARQETRYRLRELADRVLPLVSGYSRYDGSDPLENETRAEVYGLVRDSPGTYHAQIAAQTDVTEETVRYHSRVLADEGLVETQKFRGRRRLYPVTIDNDAPEITAAMADSAASSVLEVIARQEPTTLSSVADTVDCAPSTASYHLDRLEEDGLITRTRDGGVVRIRLRTDARSTLRGRMADD